MSFAAVSFLGAIVDITVDGGAVGAAGLTSATTQFTSITESTPVPEPATLTDAPLRVLMFAVAGCALFAVPAFARNTLNVGGQSGRAPRIMVDADSPLCDRSSSRHS